jgi:hypothetical protein
MASEYFRQALEEGWEAAKKAKAERRRRNQEAWAASPLNAQNQRKQAFAAAPEIKGEAKAEADSGSASLAKLRSIMGSADIPLHRRLDAAELLVSFEVAPGSASNVDPNEVAAGSYQFLRTIVDHDDVPEPLRFRALKAIAIVENARASIKANSVTHEEKRRLLLQLANAERIAALRQAGTWQDVVARGDLWFLEPEDTVDWPSGWPGNWVWPPGSISNELANGRDVGAFHRELLSIRAKNRPDLWEQYLLLAESSSATDPQNS